MFEISINFTGLSVRQNQSQESELNGKNDRYLIRFTVRLHECDTNNACGFQSPFGNCSMNSRLEKVCNVLRSDALNLSSSVFLMLVAINLSLLHEMKLT
jgi:hypothetical protein